MGRFSDLADRPFADLAGPVDLKWTPAEKPLPREAVMLGTRGRAGQEPTAKPIGIAEQARRIDWRRRMPFDPLGALEPLDLAFTIKRLQANDYETYRDVRFGRPLTAKDTDLTWAGKSTRARDIRQIESYLLKQTEETERGLTFGAKVLTGASYLPAWMVEFVATGGLKTLGSEAAKRAGRKLLGRYAKARAGQAALKTAGWAAGAAARTAGMPHRVAEATFERRFHTELAGQPENWATSIAKGWGQVFIETASEETGAAISGALTRGLARLPFGARFINALRNVWTKISPDNTAKAFAEKIFTRAGYSSIIGEIGEERLATIMHAIANSQDFGVGKDAGVIERLKAGVTQDIKNFPVEATVLSLPAATKFVASKALPSGTKAAQTERPFADLAEPRPPAGKELVLSAKQGDIIVPPETQLPKALAGKVVAKDRYDDWVRGIRNVGGWLKKFARTVPEFTLEPEFTVDDEKRLVYQDGGRFRLEPGVFGIDPETLTPGQKIRVDLASYGIKPASVAAIKKAKATGLIHFDRPILDEYVKTGKVPQRPFADLAEPSEYYPETAEPKNIENVVVDTFRDWPREIKKVGTDFWVEVMAAAKKLTTPYRYKALRRTLLGVFKHAGRTTLGIELQDVRDVLTAIHEVGHNVDWLVNDKSFPSSIKGRFPDAQVGEMTLRNELRAVSEVLRPDLWEAAQTRRGRKAYVRRHTELMADFVSHYILDPERTKSLAPNVTEAFEKKLARKPELLDTISRLQEARYESEEAPIAKHLRQEWPLPKQLKPLQLHIDMQAESYVKAAERLGITAARHYKLLMHRAGTEARRIDQLVPDKARQTDLVVIAEKAKANPWTGRTLREILAEPLTSNETKALNLYRGYQELARQTVNKYLRGADIAEYIKFIEDYFIHAYDTPLSQKHKSAVSRWAKRSPQAKKRILPDLNTAVEELGLRPRARTLSDGLRLWAGMNYRVATNLAFLKTLPKITNDDGVSILQKPSDYPHWPTVDYWPIRQTYKLPLPGRGILLFQGRVAVDPRVKPFIDAMFATRVLSTPVRIIEALNAVWKGFQLTLFSFFHHQAEFFSAAGSLGPRAMPFVGGYYGKRAQAFGQDKLFGFLPAHIGILRAGKELEKVPEFMEDYIAHGGQVGYISTEGINLMERMLRRAEHYLEELMQSKPLGPLKGIFAAAYMPVKAASAGYSFHQRVLWDNVQRAKLVAYYNIVADGAKNSNLPIEQVKEIAAKYVADNFGGQEWLNTMFRNPKTRQFWTQLMMSLDWTWSQIKTVRWPFTFGGQTEVEKARRALMRKIGRHHWFWYLAAIAGFTVAGSYALSGKGPWDNEKGHKLDIDWTNVWRNLPWNRDWKQRGDYARRYIGLGKAAREIHRWVVTPLRAFGYKLSPVARTLFEQGTGYNLGSSWPEPWAREDLEGYEEAYARFKHLMENFKPFAFSGNNAFLAFPSRKGMTQWKAIRSYEDIYDAQAKAAMGGFGAVLTRLDRITAQNDKKLMAEIAEACGLNNVDAEKADRRALAGARRKYYSLFWKATTLPEKKAVKMCNQYAQALLALGVVPEGFIQSLRERGWVPPEAQQIGIKAFQEAVQ